MCAGARGPDVQVPVLNGIYVDPVGDFRTSYPRNLVPVPKAQGISQGYLRPADGMAAFATGPGLDRGGISWDGVMHRVMGSKLCRVARDGAVTVLADVRAGGPVTLDYSFDRLSIASGGALFYWTGSALIEVNDADLGVVVDQLWVDGYFMTTDGTSLVVTELNDPTQVNPLKYGSSEADPDQVKGLRKVRGEVCALNRHTLEFFNNVGGTGFPFARIDGAQVQRGCIGTHASTLFAESLAFLGSGRNEAPAVWLAANGGTQKLSTREIDMVLLNYTEAQLSAVVLEARVDRGHQHLLVHLPDQCLVYDAAATAVVGEPVWFTLTSSIVGPGTYRARHLVWCYDRWLAGDPTSTAIGQMVSNVSTHHGQTIGWDFGTMVVYNEGRGAVVQSIELVGLPGRVALGADPVVWTSYSLDGETWSQERPARAGAQGQRQQRIAWRKQGKMRNYRMQRFRGTSDAHLAMACLEVQMEPLFG